MKILFWLQALQCLTHPLKLRLTTKAKSLIRLSVLLQNTVPRFGVMSNSTHSFIYLLISGIWQCVRKCKGACQNSENQAWRCVLKIIKVNVAPDLTPDSIWKSLRFQLKNCYWGPFRPTVLSARCFRSASINTYCTCCTYKLHAAWGCWTKCCNCWQNHRDLTPSHQRRPRWGKMKWARGLKENHTHMHALQLIHTNMHTQQIYSHAHWSNHWRTELPEGTKLCHFTTRRAECCPQMQSAPHLLTCYLSCGTTTTGAVVGQQLI